MTCIEMMPPFHPAIQPYRPPFSFFKPRVIRRLGRYKMQNAYLDPYPVSAPVEYNSHTFTIQPYHSPTSEDIFGNNALISSSASYPLTSHEHALLRLDTSGYPPILPKPPSIETVAADESITQTVYKPETHEINQNYFVHDSYEEAEAEYVNPQCVIFTFYTGDVNSVVDEHFKRSLSRPSSFSSEPSITREDEEGEDEDHRNKTSQDGNDSGIETNDSPVQSTQRESVSAKNYDAGDSTLMCRRKFPPSFWNIDYWRDIKPTVTSIVPYDGTNLTYLNGSDGGCYYQSALANMSTPYRHSDAIISAADPYSTYRQRAPGDALHYAYASASHPQSAFANHMPGGLGIHELSYGFATGGTFNPRYSSLLIQPTVRTTLLPAVPGQMELPKPSTVPDNWSPGYAGLNNYPQYFAELPTYDMDLAPSTDNNDTKDFLWF